MNDLVDHFSKQKSTRSSVPRSILLDFVQATFNKTDKIVDVGCAKNVYKQYFPNLIGIDFVDFEEADIVVSIQDAVFKQSSLDGAICFGVFHGNKDSVYKDIEKVLSWLKPGAKIAMRARAKPLDKFSSIDHFIWNNTNIQRTTDFFNLKISTIEDITYTRDNGKVLENKVWVWTK